MRMKVLLFQKIFIMINFIHFIVNFMPIERWVLVFCAISFLAVFFNKKAKNSARHWSALPGMFMGVGIFFTFLTIYDTFNYIPIKDKSSEIDTNELIKMIGSGFLGSIVGLFCGISITFYIKKQINRIEITEQEEAGENNNPYKLLQQMVANTAANNEELKAMKEIMEQSKSVAIDETLNKIEETYGQFSDELKKIFGTTNSTISEGQNALTDGINALTVALENKIDAVNQQTIGSAKKAEETIQKTIETIQANVEAKVGDINTNIEKIEKTTQNFGDNISVELEKVLKSKIESLEKAFDKIEEYQRRSQTILETTTNSFKETVDKYEQVNEDKTGLIDIIGKQLAELQAVRENGTELISHWEQIATSVECMQERINKINGVIAQLDNIKTVLANQQN